MTLLSLCRKWQKNMWQALFHQLANLQRCLWTTNAEDNVNTCRDENCKTPPGRHGRDSKGRRTLLWQPLVLPSRGPQASYYLVWDAPCPPHANEARTSEKRWRRWWISSRHMSSVWIPRMPNVALVSQGEGERERRPRWLSNNLFEAFETTWFLRICKSPRQARRDTKVT